MIKIEKKNKWAIDLSFHIPIPSFSISLIGTEKEEIQNTELSHNPAMDSVTDQNDMKTAADSHAQGAASNAAGK